MKKNTKKKQKTEHCTSIITHTQNKMNNCIIFLCENIRINIYLKIYRKMIRLI